MARAGSGTNPVCRQKLVISDKAQQVNPIDGWSYQCGFVYPWDKLGDSPGRKTFVNQQVRWTDQSDELKTSTELHAPRYGEGEVPIITAPGPGTQSMLCYCRHWLGFNSRGPWRVCLYASHEREPGDLWHVFLVLSDPLLLWHESVACYLGSHCNSLLNLNPISN